MARNHRLRAPAEASGAARHARSLAKKTKAPYKVVFEQVSEKKKKLITVLSFNSQAPPGYTFIPAGDPSITNRCKELAREDSLKVYIVSTSRHKHRTNLSHEVHRIGYHFPSLVVEKACMSLGISLTQSGQIIPVQSGRRDLQPNRRPLNRKNNNTRSSNASLSANVSQAALNTQAEHAIKDLFPKIPAKDVRAIIDRAFAKGTSRVGTAVELTLPRRVQLAVVAHIRHVYTDYDSLLKTGTYYEARAAIEKPCLDLLAQWRSDDDDDPNAMEEILREVIVIDDDDEEDGDCKSPIASQQHDNRDDSVEIISSHAFANEVQMRQIDYSNSAQISDWDQLHSPQRSSRTIVQNPRLEQYHRHEQQRNNDSTRLDASSIHHLRWQEALHRRKNSITAHTNNNSLVQDLTSPRRSFLENGFEPQFRYSEGVGHETRSVEIERITQPQGPSYSEVDSAWSQKIPEKPTRLFSNEGVNGTPPKSRQVLLPEQEHIPNGPVEHEEFNRRVEETHNTFEHHLDQRPKNVISGENPRATGNRYSEQNPFHDTLHDRQIQRVLPSVEGSFQERRRLGDVFSVSSEHSSRPSHAFPNLNSKNEPRHEIIKLRNKDEISTGKHRTNDKMVFLPLASVRHIPKESYQQRGIFTSESHDQWLDSRQHHDLPMRLSRLNTFPREEHDLYLYPVDAKQSQKKNEPAQLLESRVNYANHQNQIIDRGQAKHVFHESFQTPMKFPSLRQQHQNVSHHANDFPRLSPQFPNFHGVYKSLPISHVPLESIDSRHYVNVDSTSKRMCSGVDKSGMTSLGEFNHGLLSKDRNLDNSSMYEQENSRRVYGYENSRTNYMPHDDSVQDDVHETARTGLFLRKINNEYKNASASGPGIENKHVQHNFERLAPQRSENTISCYDGSSVTQAQRPIEETYKQTPTRRFSKADGNTWHGFERERPRYAYIEDQILPPYSTTRADRLEPTHGSEYVSLNRRVRPEIIEID